MKNRKLFAIITLVAFMLTMMPMMAFAAATASGSSIAVDDASALNNGTDKLEFVLDLDANLADQMLVIFAERNGSLSDADTIVVKNAAGSAQASSIAYTGAFTSASLTAGEYTVEVTSTVAGTVKLNAFIISGYDPSDAPDSIAALYNGSSDFIKTALIGNGATGKFNTTSSTITITPTVVADGFVLAGDLAAGFTGASANNGLDVYKVNVAVTKGGSKAVGEKVTVSVDKTGLYISETELTTSATGKADFKVSAAKPGTYLLSIACGNEVKEFTVKFVATAATKGAFNWATPDTIATGINETVAKLTFTDGNGNTVAVNDTNLSYINSNFKVEVIGAPADSALKDAVDAVEINNGEYIVKINPDFAGEYTVKVINNNTGVADTTTFKAAEYGKTVSATISYPSNTYLLSETTQVPTVKVVDQNGVKKTVPAGSKSFSYSGVGVTTFDKATGQVSFNADDKYAGNQIVVTVVAENKFAASATLTIANEPAALVFADANGAIGTEVKASFKVVDIAGKDTAISADDQYDVRVQNALIIDRPAGAIVSVDASGLGADGKAEKDLLKTGKGTIKVVSDKEGVVKVNVILGVYAPGAAADAQPAFYLAGVANVAFGTVVPETDETSTVTLIIGSTTFVANGKAEVAPVAPAVIDGRTLVPVRAFAQATGAEVVYDGNTKVITITAEGLLAQMTVGSNILTVNGQTIVMDSAATLIDGSTVLPVRYAGQALGYDFECAYGANGAVASVTMFK